MFAECIGKSQSKYPWNPAMHSLAAEMCAMCVYSCDTVTAHCSWFVNIQSTIASSTYRRILKPSKSKYWTFSTVVRFTLPRVHKIKQTSEREKIMRALWLISLNYFGSCDSFFHLVQKYTRREYSDFRHIRTCTVVQYLVHGHESTRRCIFSTLRVGQRFTIIH